MYTHRPLPEEPSRWVHVDCRDRLAVLEPGIPDLVLGSAEGKWECALHGPGLWKTLAQQELQIQLEAAIVKVYHLIRLEWQRSGDWNFPMLTRATFETLAQNVAPSTRYSVYNVGPDGKVSEPTDEPALRSAARSGRAEIVSLLLENHADVHAKDDQALLLAAENGHVETVKVLLEHGADYHAKNDRALQSAASHGHIDVISLFLDRIDNVSAVCTAALPWAAQGGSTETVDFLLSRGADVHAKTRDLGEAALIYAAGSGRTETVKLLLEHGADIHAQDDYALRAAADDGHTATVKLLLEHGADICANDGQAVAWAIENGHTETTAVLRAHVPGKKDQVPEQ